MKRKYKNFIFAWNNCEELYETSSWRAVFRSFMQRKEDCAIFGLPTAPNENYQLIMTK